MSKFALAEPTIFPANSIKLDRSSTFLTIPSMRTAPDSGRRIINPATGCKIGHAHISNGPSPVWTKIIMSLLVAFRYIYYWRAHLVVILKPDPSTSFIAYLTSPLHSASFHLVLRRVSYCGKGEANRIKVHTVISQFLPSGILNVDVWVIVSEFVVEKLPTSDAVSEQDCESSRPSYLCAASLVNSALVVISGPTSRISGILNVAETVADVPMLEAAVESEHESHNFRQRSIIRRTFHTPVTHIRIGGRHAGRNGAISSRCITPHFAVSCITTGFPCTICESNVW